MPTKKNITILKTETANRILAKKNQGTSNQVSGGYRQGQQPRLPVQGQPQLIKIVAEADEKGGYYKVKPVVRDVTEGEAENHTWFDPDLTDEMYGLEITGAEGITEDDKKAYLAMPIVDSSGRILWAFSQGGGAAENRPWVVIGSNVSPGVYTGTVYDAPEGNVIESNADIRLKPIYSNIPSNDFPNDWADFADVVGDGEEKTYYISGVLLG